MPNLKKFLELADYSMYAAQLQTQDVAFVLDFYALHAYHQGKLLRSMKFTPSALKFIHGKATPAEVKNLSKHVEEFLDFVAKKVKPSGKFKLATNFVEQGAAATELDYSKIEESVFASLINDPKFDPNAKTGTVAYTDAKPASLDKPIPLREAKHLRQAVHGTSAGSTYRVAALSPEYALAIKFEPNSMSLRIELREDAMGNPIPTNVEAAAKAMGFQNKSGSGHPYASLHMQHTGIPRERVLGAVMFDLGKVFTDRVGSLAELLNEK